MENEITQALNYIRQMPIEKMVALKFITKQQIDQYIKENQTKEEKCQH